MHLISVSEIIIPESRQRKNFPLEKSEELKTSIRTKGLLNPITLRADGKTLVSGERRLRAMVELHQTDIPFTFNGKKVDSGKVPFTFLSELSPLELEEVELEENVVRLDISWQERAAALAKLHTLRQLQATSSGKEHTTSDLIEELTGSREGGSFIRDTLHIARHLDDPDVAKASSQKEATKIIKKKLAAEHRKSLAETMQKKETPHTIICGDALEHLKKFPDNTFDLLLTDPPYCIGADNFGGQAGISHNYKDDGDSFYIIHETLAKESFRCCKPEAHAYVFCDFNFFSQLSLTFSMAGWNVWPRPLIWYKRNGMLARPEHGPRYTYEVILFASKGDKKVTQVRPDLLDYGQVQDQMHAAEKPVPLFQDLIQRSCLPGNLILDPFAGSGTTLEAGALEDCVVTLVEKLPENYNMCMERLANLELEI